MPHPLTKKIGFAALIMMASVFLSRVIGLIREMVIADIGGATGEIDVYQVAFVIPEILNHVVASGFLSVTFIPIFTKYLTKDQEADGWHIFSVIISVLGIVLIVLIMIAMWFAPLLVSVIAPGFNDPEQIASAITMTRIIIPAQFFFFTGGLLMAVQFAKEQFKIPALAPLIYNIGIISGGLILSPWLGVQGFSWGVLVGAFVGNFWVQLVGAKRVGMRFRFVLNFGHPDLKKYILLTLPLMVGLTMTFSTEFFFKFFGSYLSEGSIASLNYALRVMLILVGLFGQAAGVASFPFLTRLVAEGKMHEMNMLLNDILRRYIALVIPFSVLMMLLSHEIILLLFQRGHFDAAATEMTSQALVFLLIGTFAFAAQTVVVRGYYATQNTLFPAIYSTLAVIISIPIYWYGMHESGLQGVAFAVSASAIIQTSLLYALWNRRTNNKESRQVYLFFIKIILLSVTIGIFLQWFKSDYLGGIDNTSFMGSIMLCSIIGGIFLISFIGAGYALRITEIVRLTEYATKRFRVSKIKR